MKRPIWILAAVVGMLAWIGTGPGVAHAQIPPVSTSAPFSPIPSPSVTVSIFQGATNVTGTWLPEPNQPVTLAVNVGGVVDPTATISLVCPDGLPTTSTCLPPGAPFNPISAGLLRTSAYPGQCTNFDNPSLNANAVDFTLTGSVLLPNDCGGMAVIQVTPTAGGGPFTFILPQDSNFNGLPDIWEAKYCPPGVTQTGCPLTANGDADSPPVVLAGSPTGDGIAALDEYRGFIVSGIHIRTNPLQKDLFVHLVNPQCSTATGSTTSLFLTYPVDEAPATNLTLSATSGGGVTFATGSAVFNPSHVGADIRAATGVGVATITAFVSQTTVTANVTLAFAGTSLASGAWTIRPSLFGNLDNLISGTQVHLLGFTPRSTNSTTGEWVDRFSRYTEAGGFEYLNPDGTTTTTAPADDRQINKNALYPLTDTVTGNAIQKGLRVTECLDEGLLSPLGVAGRGSPNGPDNALIYTKRILNAMTSAINAGSPLQYSTYFNGAWQTPVSATADFLISKALLYYLGMEVGHAVQLTSTIITGKGGTSYGYHYAPNTGDNLDQALTSKVSTKGNTFWIPSLYNTTGQGQFKAKN